MADWCPGCDLRDRERELLERQVRNYADELSRFAGGIIGRRLGGTSGQVIGREIAPNIIETTALAIRDKIRKPSKKQKKRSKMLSKNLSIANKKARKKDGSLKKGWSQSRIMQTAHRMCK